MVAGEQGLFLDQLETDVVHRVAGRRHGAQRKARAGQNLAILHRPVGQVIQIVRGVELVRLTQIKLARSEMRGAAQDRRAGALLQKARGWRMVAVRVGHQNMSDGLSIKRIEQRLDMGRKVGAGVDHRHLSGANNIGAGAGEGEGAGIGRDQPPHQRRHSRHFAGGGVESPLETRLFGGRLG